MMNRRSGGKGRRPRIRCLLMLVVVFAVCVMVAHRRLLRHHEHHLWVTPSTSVALPSYPQPPPPLPTTAQPRGEAPSVTAKASGSNVSFQGFVFRLGTSGSRLAPMEYDTRVLGIDSDDMQGLFSVDSLSATVSSDQFVSDDTVRELPVTIRHMSSQLFLSRNSASGRISIDKLEARSAEKWRLVAVKPIEAQSSGHMVTLYGVPSEFQPDAGQRCIVENNANVDAAHCSRLHFRIPTNDSPCASWLISRQRVTVGVPDRENHEKKSSTAPSLVIVMTGKSLSKMPTTEEAKSQLEIYASWWSAIKNISSMRLSHVGIVLCVDDVDDIERIVHSSFRNASTAPSNAYFTLTPACEQHSRFQRPTYRGMFAAAEASLQRYRKAHLDFHGDAVGDFVMYVNSDIIIPAFALEAAVTGAELFLRENRKMSSGNSSRKRHVLLTGRRWNCPRKSKVIRDGAEAASSLMQWNRLLQRHCTLYTESAEDYFLVSKGTLPWGDTSRDMLSWHGEAFQRAFLSDGVTTYRAARDPVPPLVVGGIAFDNWLVATVATLQDGVVIDASAALPAAHLGATDGPQLLASHMTDASRYNSEAAHYCGGWSLGKVTSQPLVMTGNRVDASKTATYLRELALHKSDDGACLRRIPLDQARPLGTSFDSPWKGPD